MIVSMNIKQLSSNNIDNLKKLTPDIYKPSLHMSIPFFAFHKILFEKGEDILSNSHNLTQSELDVLGALYYGGGEDFSLMPTELYEIMLFSSGGLTKVLKKLELKEYIKRFDSKEDKRVKIVQITKQGKEITQKALLEVISYEEQYFSKLDDNEQKEFSRLLYKMLD